MGQAGKDTTTGRTGQAGKDETTGCTGQAGKDETTGCTGQAGKDTTTGCTGQAGKDMTTGHGGTHGTGRDRQVRMRRQREAWDRHGKDTTTGQQVRDRQVRMDDNGTHGTGR